MSNIKILVEGIADAKFLQDLINKWYDCELKIADLEKVGDIIYLGGKTAFDSANKLTKLSTLFEQAAFLDIPVIVIFDADIYVESQSQLLVHSQTHGFQFFLLPNNESDGDLEVLLQEIICSDNQVIFDCWQAYEKCLNTASAKFTTPAKKTKIYAYLEALLDKSEKDKIKEANRDYRNPRHWNLDPTHPPLKPLKEFLDPFFSTQ